MAKNGAALKTAVTPKGIIDLEFAYNSIKTTTVINAWKPDHSADNMTAAKINTYLDFIFIFFYSLFLFFAGKKTARINNSKTGLLIAKGALLAGFLDVLENGGMLMTLSGNSSGAVALFTTTASVIKWTLVLAAVVYLIAGIFQLIAKKKFMLLAA